MSCRDCGVLVVVVLVVCNCMVVVVVVVVAVAVSWLVASVSSELDWMLS